MKKRLLLTVAGMMVFASTVFAVSAKPGLKKKVQLSDGSVVELTLKGDEHYSFYVDKDGKPCKVQNGRLVMMTPEKVGEIWTERKAKRLSLKNNVGSRRAGTPSKTTTGNQRGLVILLQFPDKKFVTENPQSTFKRFFNEEGYSENGMTGSVRDYFKKQSYGKLTIDFDVVGPYTVSKEMSYYGKHKTNSRGEEENDAHPALMVAEAVDSAHVDGVDFSKYDWDNDGEVDQVFVIYAGYAEAQGGDENTIWPHEWVLAAEKATREYDKVTINTYGCASELRGNSGSELDGIGSACHEFSHCLGLPDAYDTSGGSNFGMGNWDIMCSGNYNDGSRTPAGYTSYERWFARWIQPTEINSLTRIENMKPLASEPEAYVLYNEKNKNEYYLLENRQAVDFDKGLSGHGLLIMHVDYDENTWKANAVNNTEGHERMTIIPADNAKVEGRESYAGDPWPGTSGNTALSNYSTPAAILYNENSDGAKLMNKPIGNITENLEGRISFVVCHPGVEPPTYSSSTKETEDGFTISWNAVTDATSYEVELTEIPAATKDTAEAKQLIMDFSECYSKSDGLIDIGDKLSQRGFPSGWDGTNLFTSPNGLKFGSKTAKGTLNAPWIYCPESGEFTIVLGTSSESATGTLIFTSAEVDGGYVLPATATQQTASFEFTKPGRLVFNFKSTQDAYKQNLTFNKTAYLNYYALYYGTFNAKELGIDEEAGSKTIAKRRATTTTLSTSDTNYTFTGLTKTSTFMYRVRAIGPEVTSGWSEQQTFKFSTTGVSAINVDANADPVRYFDLQGREVDASAKGLLIRKQGSDVKKVMVK